MFRKGLVVAIIILFVGASVIPITGGLILKKQVSTNNEIPSIQGKIQGNTLYVGGTGEGNYTTIQDAIDNASNGDTVFVFDDSSPYNENIIVDKSISLIGEDKNTTVIDGEYGAHVIRVSTDWVNISGFKIQNIYSGTLESGIAIRNSNNNSIIDNKIWANFYGIWLDSSNGNKIKGNSISYSEVLIYLEESNNNIISDNSIFRSFNYAMGIIFSDSNNNKFINNTVSDHVYGISLWNSGNNIISDNIVLDNYVSGLYLTHSNGNTIHDNSFYNDGVYIKDSYHINVSGNTVNDEPIVYLEDESDKVIDEDVGQVILVSCNNITVKNQEISDVCIGITLINTHNSLFSNNVRISGRIGLYFYLSNNNYISNNSLNIIFYDYSCYNNIIGNNLSNVHTGILLWNYCCNNTIKNNYITNNDEGVDIGMYCSGNVVIGNNISNNINNYGYGHGITLSGRDYNGSNPHCDNNTVIGNFITNNGDGIYLYHADNNFISNNFISENKEGIELGGRCYKNCIENNNITFNNGSGILLKYSSNLKNTIKDNNIVSNNGDGLYIHFYMANPSSNNSIYHNNFINNTRNAYDECNNSWDNEVSGNFWDDYNGTDNDGDGIGDTPYNITGGNNKDRYPLMEPWDGLNLPPDTPVVNGQLHGKVRVEYEFSFSLSDPNNDPIYLRVDWGSGTPGPWHGPYNSGAKVKLNHTWKKKGTYTIRAQSKDNYDMSDWGELTITMPRNKAISSSLFLQFLERFPLLERFLNSIYGR